MSIVPSLGTNSAQAIDLFKQNTVLDLENLRYYGTNSSDVIALINLYLASSSILNYENLSQTRAFKFIPEDAKNSIKTISTGESVESWTAGVNTTITANTTTGEFYQGSQSRKLTSTSTGLGEPLADYDVTLDLTTFEDGTVSLVADTIEVGLYINNISYLTSFFVRFYTSLVNKNNNYAQISYSAGELTTGWNKAQTTKNSYTYTNFTDSDWANVKGVRFYFTSANTSLEVSLDYTCLLPNILSQFQVLDKADTSNTDNTSGSVLTLGNNGDGSTSTRFQNKLIGVLSSDYLVIENNVSGGYGAGYPILSKSDNSITVSGTLPTLSSNVSWIIERPIWIIAKQKTAFLLEDGTGSGMFKIASLDVKTASSKILLSNIFKPINPNQNFFLKAHFEFRANSSKQGFILYYLDNNNYVVAYITKNGGSSTFKIDKIIGGSTTNLVTSDTFTLNDDDGIIFVVYLKGQDIYLYASEINSPSISLKTSINFYDYTIDSYRYNVGLYSDLELRVLEFECNEGNDFNNSFTKTISGTFATASTLTISDNSIHKTSLITSPKNKSTPVSSIYQSSQTNGTVVYTSGSGSETLQLEASIFN